MSIPGSKPGSGMGMGGKGVGMVLKLDYYILDMINAQETPALQVPLDYIQLASNFHKAMLIRLGVASTNRTDKFWHTGSTEEYSSEEFDG